MTLVSAQAQAQAQIDDAATEPTPPDTSSDPHEDDPSDRHVEGDDDSELHGRRRGGPVHRFPHVAELPRSAAGETGLSLAEVLDFAARNAPSVAIARARVGLADADVAEAAPRVPSNPEVSVAAGRQVGQTWQRPHFAAAIHQRLAVAGELRLRRGAARARRDAAEALVDEVQWLVRVEAQRLYGEILLAQQHLAQHSLLVEHARVIHRVTLREIAAGEATRIERLVAEVDLARAESDFAEAARTERALRFELGAVIGWPVDDAAPPRVSGSPVDVRRAPPLPELLNRMAEMHPSLRARELAVRAAELRVAAEDRAVAPNPEIGIAYQRMPNLGPPGWLNIWSIQLSVPIPLAQRNQGPRARARAEREIAEAELAARTVELVSSLRRAALNVNVAAERVETLADRVVGNLEISLRLLERAYEVGEVGIHEVSLTHERLLGAVAEHLNAKKSYLGAVAALESLVGATLSEMGGPAPEAEGAEESRSSTSESAGASE